MIKSHFQNVEKLKDFLPKKDFLLAGKGPSIDKWDDSYNKKFNVIGINHVAQMLKTNISHFTDIESFSSQTSHSQYLIVSGMMNENYKTTVSLENLINSNSAFKQIYKEKRLFTYDIITDQFSTKLFSKQKPLIFKYASGVLLIQIASLLKLDKVYTIGIDGGISYSKQFEKTKGNGLFLDEQIKMMNKLAEQNNIQIIKI